MLSAKEVPELGVVVIGRNEGERLGRCLQSVLGQCLHVVYVDSGSEDGSVAVARGLGVDVVELDLTVPFTAARARNAGWRRLQSTRPLTVLVQFIDGDCELIAGWISAAVEALGANPAAAVVCGRRRERFRDATVYNRLCDMEWNTPIGEVEACGGDALMRLEALECVDGYDPSLICGEEPDLCRRLRKLGRVVMRIDADMTLHDAAMTRAGQWWRRSTRAGFGAAESIARYKLEASATDRRCVRGVILWIVVIPTLLFAGITFGAWRGSADVAVFVGALVPALTLAQVLRISVLRRTSGDSEADALLYGLFCMLGKLPQALGMLRYLRSRLESTAPSLIEYK